MQLGDRKGVRDAGGGEASNLRMPPLPGAHGVGQEGGGPLVQSVGLDVHRRCLCWGSSSAHCFVVPDFPSKPCLRLSPINPLAPPLTLPRRSRIARWTEKSLVPGDVVTLAESRIAFVVDAVEPSPASDPVPFRAGSAPPPSRGTGPPSVAGSGGRPHEVAAALQLAAALEARAAAHGVFAPPAVLARSAPSELGEMAAALQGEREFQQAYMLLLGAAMRHPGSGALWARLANLQRQRVRAGESGGSYGAARAFYRAAAACFEAAPAGAADGGSAGEAEAAERAEGLARVFSGWALMEFALGNGGSARNLFHKVGMGRVGVGWVGRACEGEVGGQGRVGVTRTCFAC